MSSNSEKKGKYMNFFFHLYRRMKNIITKNSNYSQWEYNEKPWGSLFVRGKVPLNAGIHFFLEKESERSRWNFVGACVHKESKSTNPATQHRETALNEASEWVLWWSVPLSSQACAGQAKGSMLASICVCTLHWRHWYRRSFIPHLLSHFVCCQCSLFTYLPTLRSLHALRYVSPLQIAEKS